MKKILLMIAIAVLVTSCGQKDVDTSMENNEVSNTPDVMPGEVMPGDLAPVFGDEANEATESKEETTTETESTENTMEAEATTEEAPATETEN